MELHQTLQNCRDWYAEVPFLYLVKIAPVVFMKINFKNTYISIGALRALTCTRTGERTLQATEVREWKADWPSGVCEHSKRSGESAILCLGRTETQEVENKRGKL